MHAAKPAYDKLIFELSSPGRFAYSLPESDVPDGDPAALLPRAVWSRPPNRSSL
jgi:glycine dehydrogenase subunit 2